MEVYKFRGASVRNIKNVHNILKVLNQTVDNYKYNIVYWKFLRKNFENFKTPQVFVNQVILALNLNNFTVSLDRKSSNYLATIIAYCLNFKGVIRWKDFIGLITIDLYYYIDSNQTLKSFSYKKAMNMSFFGASNFKPKIILPLYKDFIPLTFCFLLEIENQSTNIMKDVMRDTDVSCFIQKLNVHLLSIFPFNFFTYNLEDTLYIIFKQLIELNINISLISISAFSVLLTIENKFNSINILLNIPSNSFNVTLQEKVRLYLYMITNSSKELQNKLNKGKTILL